MGWWPFSKAKAKKAASARHVSNDNLLRKDAKTWLNDMRDVCEMNFDSPEEGRRRIRVMQVEWKDAEQLGLLDQSNRDGLERRAYRLLACSDDEWLKWIDDLEFWKIGWRPEPLDPNE